jgi:hypothetical protein
VIFDVGSVHDILQLVNSAGVVGMLVLILWGGFKKWWVFGWQYRQTKNELETWREIALRGISTAEQATALAHRTKRFDND